jgi:hypothetical protein
MSNVEMHGKIIPKNGNSFMLMDAEYIDYDGNGTTSIKVKVDNIINEVSGSTNYVSTISNLITALTSSKDVFLADTTFLLTSHLTSISSSINVVGKEGTIIDGSSVYRIKPDNLANVTFKNITFQNFLGFESYNCKNLKFINCKFINTQSNAISFNTSVGGIYLVKDCYFENIGIAVANDDDAKGMGLGVTINGPGELTVEGCEFYKKAHKRKA